MLVANLLVKFSPNFYMSFVCVEFAYLCILIMHYNNSLLICVILMYFLILLFYVDPASGLPYAINLCCCCCCYNNCIFFYIQL